MWGQMPDDLPLVVYPSRNRALLGFVVGAVLMTIVVANHSKVAEAIGTAWFMYPVFYALPLLALVAGFKGFPACRLV